MEVQCHNRGHHAQLDQSFYLYVTLCLFYPSLLAHVRTPAGPAVDTTYILYYQNRFSFSTANPAAYVVVRELRSRSRTDERLADLPFFPDVHIRTARHSSSALIEITDLDTNYHCTFAPSRPGHSRTL